MEEIGKYECVCGHVYELPTRYHLEDRQCPVPTCGSNDSVIVEIVVPVNEA